MSSISKIADTVKPYKELLATAVFLLSMGYAGITYFATVKQLSAARDELQQEILKLEQKSVSLINEFKCLNDLGREYLRAQIEEINIRNLLERNLEKSNLLAPEERETQSVEMSNIRLNQQTLMTKLSAVENDRQTVLVALQKGACSKSS